MIKRIALVLIVIALLMIRCDCGPDPIEPPPSLTGDYVGEYYLKSGDSPEQCQDITFRFTSDRFLMKLDTNLMKEADRVFCDASGAYEMSSNVTLSATSSLDSNRTEKICNTTLGPFGSYALDQSQTGIVILQSKVGDITRMLTLYSMTQ
jgi:hypothetical protein